MLACIVALASILTIVPTINASAETIHWLQGDINDNGYVDLTDLTLFVKYANGFYPTNNATTTRLDLNDNKIIDQQDYSLLYNYNLATGTLNGQVNNNKPVITNVAAESKTYFKHIEGTGEHTYTTYNLNVQRGLADSRTMIDEQMRNSFYPETLQCIVAIGDSNRNFGTGFIIGDHTIATASHCVCEVFSNTEFRFFDDLKVRIYPANLNNYATIDNALATFDVKITHVPEEHITEFENCTYYYNNKLYYYDIFAAYDYALIEVSNNLSAYGKMQLGSMTKELVSTTPTVTMSGFTDPWYVEGSGIYNNKRYRTSGTIQNLSGIPTSYFKVIGGISSGQSGGPVYYTPNGGTEKIVLGINSMSNDIESVLVRITPTLRRFYYGNNYLVTNWN